MKKNKVIKTEVTPIEIRVSELHSESISWLGKFFHSFIELFPMSRRSATTPKSVKEYRIGDNEPDRSKPGINKAMSRVISPFKKIKQHMNILTVIIMAILLSLLVSCGDSTTGPVNNNGDGILIFSLDSLGIYGSGFHQNDLIDTLTIDSGNLKVTFDIETDCDSLDFPSIYFSFETNDTTITRYLPILSASYTFNYNVSKPFLNYMFGVVFGLDPYPIIPKYLRFKNIKIYN